MIELLSLLPSGMVRDLSWDVPAVLDEAWATFEDDDAILRASSLSSGMRVISDRRLMRTRPIMTSVLLPEPQGFAVHDKQKPSDEDKKERRSSGSLGLGT